MANFKEWWNPGVWFLEQFAWHAMAASTGNTAYSHGRKASLVTAEAKIVKTNWHKKPIAESIRK
jgi:hypothetical protein